MSLFTYCIQKLHMYIIEIWFWYLRTVSGPDSMYKVQQLLLFWEQW